MRVATLCIRRGSPAVHTPLPFSLETAERLPPWSAYYKVPSRAFIKNTIHLGHNLLLPNYVGHIGIKPMYDTHRTLKSIDDILIRSEIGV
jgi:hypothetical protein